METTSLSDGTPINVGVQGAINDDVQETINDDDDVQGDINVDVQRDINVGVQGAINDDVQGTINDSVQGTINNGVESELRKTSESECNKFHEDVCQESNNNSNGVCIMKANSDNKLLLENEKSSTQTIDAIKNTSMEYVFRDQNSQPFPSSHSRINDVNKVTDCQSIEKLSDPFDLSTEEEQSKEKYHPIKRKLRQTHDNTTYLALHCFSSEKKLPELSSNFSCIKETIADTTSQPFSESTDQFDLLAEKEVSHESYEPFKRSVYHGKQKRTDNMDSEAGLDEGMSKVDAFEIVEHVIPKIKRQRTALRVTYVHSLELLEKTNALIRIEGRAKLVHSLINAFGLLRYIELAAPRLATEVEVLGFHCPDYIAYLRDISVSGDSEETYNPSCNEAENYGLSYDCPVQKGIYETCCLISGATIAAAEQLVNNTADVAINWYGGWHHAKRDSASGFCYINDIVLGILKLREKFDRILYVDIDLHHGDGVEEAFSMTPKVMTVSFHKFASGFFPGSGSIDDVGTGKGRFYSVNAPLLDGIKDAEFFAVFCRVMQVVRERFQPQVVVMQCGADSLSSDPMASFNLTHFGLAKCVGFMLSWSLPTMLLGGGGYNFPNTAKCWTFLTALAAGKKLPLDIPEHEHLLSYGPDFEMSTTAGNRKDCNTNEYLASLVEQITRNLSNIKGV